MLGRVLVFCAVVFLGFSLFLLFARPTQLHQLTDDTAKPTAVDSVNSRALRLERNPFTNGVVSDGRTYSVSLIDANKNKIPTGTELFVQGTLLTAKWTQDNACTWFLARGYANVQHGDDPTSYCRFSILLTEKRKDGEDMWPAAALVCDVTPQELKETTRLYHYGDEVQVHGSYAATLDFGAVAGLGGHFGVPVLQGCTFGDPTPNVVRAEPVRNIYAPNTDMSVDRSPSSVTTTTLPTENNANDVRRIGGAVSSPILISSSQPEYSEEARKAKTSGSVLVNLIVNKDGMPQNVHVLRGLGMGLDEKAIEAVQQYRFKPAMEGGKPVPVECNVEVNFQIF
jgi:TonB family protein